MRKLLLLVLSCAPMFALSLLPSSTNKEIIRPSPKKFYINNLDIIEFHEGVFRVIFYSSENFDIFDGVNLKRVRANKNGIYFLEKDIKEIFREPWPTPRPLTDYPSLPDLQDTPPYPDEFPQDIIDPLPIPIDQEQNEELA